MPVEVKMYDRREMVSVSDIARRWGVSRQKVYNLVDEGKLSGFRFGFSSAMYFPLEQVRELEKGTPCEI